MAGARIVLAAAWLAVALGPVAAAQEPAAPEGDPAPAEKVAAAPAAAPIQVDPLGLVRAANPMLWPLGLCSIVVVGFTLERLIALRRGRVLPADFVNRFLERLAAGKLDRERAAELCRAHDSPAARVFGHAVRYWGQPAATIRQALAHDAAGEVADLRKNIRALNGTATLAPLLGLLGTVIGLIESFDALGGRAGSGVPKGEALAHGISLALVATAVGLGIAIVSVTAYYFLLGRVDALVRELDDKARRVVELICAEAWPSAVPERRQAPVADHAHTHARPEPRTLGRAEIL